MRWCFLNTQVLRWVAVLLLFLFLFLFFFSLLLNEFLFSSMIKVSLCSNLCLFWGVSFSHPVCMLYCDTMLIIQILYPMYLLYLLNVTSAVVECDKHLLVTFERGLSWECMHNNFRAFRLFQEGLHLLLPWQLDNSLVQKMGN